MWSTPIDQYCERLDPSFWAEPVNALTNVAFIVAAAMALLEWRRAGGRDRPVLALIVVVFAIGLGSFAFHTLATRGARLLDVIPIGITPEGRWLFAPGGRWDLATRRLHRFHGRALQAPYLAPATSPTGR